MSTEENKAIVRRYRELHNTNAVDVLGEVLAPQFVAHEMLPNVPSYRRAVLYRQLAGQRQEDRSERHQHVSYCQRQDCRDVANMDFMGVLQQIGLMPAQS